MKSRRNGGFTLIELVVVIALLGILAAFAIPRFASLEREARIATVQGLAGSVRSASTMAHGLFVATGATPVNMEGAAINITNGYPDANDIANTLADTSGFAVTVNGPGTQTTIAKTGPASGCEVVYTEPAAAGTVPAIVVDTSGC
jgi:MSHA pilin protein MshA